MLVVAVREVKQATDERRDKKDRWTEKEYELLEGDSQAIERGEMQW